MQRAVLRSLAPVIAVYLVVGAHWLDAQEGSFIDVRPVAGLNTGTWESMGSVSGDGRTIYFTSDRDPSGELSDYRVDLWVATWNPETGAFEDPVSDGILTNVNSDYDECTPYISDDNLVLAFYSDRPGSDGYDIWVAVRPNDRVVFGVAVNAKETGSTFSGVNSSYNEFGHSMSPDGLTVYFSSDRTVADSRGQHPFGGFDLYAATRPSLDEPFLASTVVNLGVPLSTEAHEFSPIVSSDGGTIFWSDLDVAPFRDHKSANIWMATRSEAGGEFGAVKPVPGINTGAVEFDFFVTRDWPRAGAKIYFSSDRDGVLDSPDLPFRGDIWMATWAPDRPFRRGDTRPDGLLDLTDGIATLLFLFAGGEELPCLDAADTDDDGILQVTDAVAFFNYLYLGGSAPAAPFGECGGDPTRGDALHCPEYPPCGENG